MYDIKINPDESIEVDFWSRRIAIARELRPDAWSEVLEGWQADGNVLDFDPTPVRDLFCDVRIDAVRARRMLDAKGDTRAAPIDTIPEFALYDDNQMIEDEAVNEDLIFDALKERLGMDGIIMGYRPHIDAFVDMRETLRAEGKILPGMRGL